MNYKRKFSIFVGGVLTDAVLTFLFSFSLFTRHSFTNDAITWFEKLCDEIDVRPFQVFQVFVYIAAPTFPKRCQL